MVSLPGISKHLKAQGDHALKCPLDTFFDLVTLTFDLFDLDLDILPLDLYAKIQVCMSVRSAVRVRHTDRRCQNYYTRHVTDVGCNNQVL